MLARKLSHANIVHAVPKKASLTFQRRSTLTPEVKDHPLPLPETSMISPTQLAFVAMIILGEDVLKSSAM
jgi:hypothetical protein